MTNVPSLFGLYVHWPFCVSKCPYCDFNSHVTNHVDHDRWCQALLRELDYYAALTPGRVLGSIFFGGGTPSLMAPRTVEAVLERAAAHWTWAEDIELTLEANPGAIDCERFQAFRHAGINRVSLGVQSLVPESLGFLERRHGVREALEAIETAARLFPRFSFDLIYARPGQTPAQWEAELSQALDLATGGHISLYQLTIEQGTRFQQDVARGAFTLPEDDLALDLWAVTHALTADRGMPYYEVSNHAVPGQESRHNLLYWLGGEYVGIGPGAHGRICVDGTFHATRQHRAPDVWLKTVLRDGHATRQKEPLTSRARAEENVMMGLRLRRGIDPDAFRLACHGFDVSDLLDGPMLALLRAEGLVADGWPLRVTDRGMPVLNAIIGALVQSS
ncbi:coproporphyrinogen III oxidase [Haematospirillum jordaniae]|uniref:Heme chaperone HemW n=1 Tax=Haematospirillum jordaniae TaxID=1549855 RepID=A0A143DCJ1_9PROT|nr:coproporphyrinogen III oxidase [Haematospirillum jordaniae]